MGQLASADPSIGHPSSSAARDPDDVGRFLDGVEWAYETPHLRALGFDFSVRASSETVGRYLHELLSAFEVHDDPVHVYSFIVGRATTGERYEVYRDRECVSTTGFPSTALRHLLWDVNRSVVGATQDHLLVHASALEHEGRTIVFPAPTGSGKTTLVAGLLQAGLRYVTDEAVAIDPTTLTVRPYPKPLAIETGSWGLLNDIRPDVDRSLVPFLEEGWYLPPSAIGAGAVATPSVPRSIISPRYERGARTELTEIRRSEALIMLAENSFNIAAFGARVSMAILAEIVRGSRCFRLSVGDLWEACDLVMETLE